MSEPLPVAILGGSGYTALELVKILLRHPNAEIAAIVSRQAEAGQSTTIARLHPSLLGRIDLEIEPYDVASLVERKIQCAFGCLPHGTSIELLGPLVDAGITVIDLSADYRLRDPEAYRQWYGAAHGDVRHLSEAVYGLPEIYGSRIPEARLIANPGCYPQTAILGLAPLLAKGLIEPRGIIVDSKSGISGAGRTPKLATHYPECNENLTAYSVGSHRHTPEIEQVLSDVAGQTVEVIFTPHLTPMDRGIFSTIYATPKRTPDLDSLVRLYRDYYASDPFVRLRDAVPNTKDCTGTNFIDIHLQAVRGKILVFAAEDNLIRGASGVAVQNFNRRFGFDETAGLL